MRDSDRAPNCAHDFSSEPFEAKLKEHFLLEAPHSPCRQLPNGSRDTAVSLNQEFREAVPEPVHMHPRLSHEFVSDFISLGPTVRKQMNNEHHKQMALFRSSSAFIFL